ncbi:serine hydrolase domain-containing protein [Glaciecola sp. 1036]|uniref:serine hydrolase domain-containing protein n=1 Tax=Alteromonadaceae TaxID=72275 RepID=UPI003D049CC6
MRIARVGKLLLSIIFVIVFLQPPSQANTIHKKDSNKANSIAQIVDLYLKHHAFEGVVLVANAGKPIFTQAYGFANRAENVPLTAESPFQLASLSKPITATLILMLKEQGKLALNDPLSDYLPEFKTSSGKEITLHHLLSHTSGIPNHFIIDGWFDSDFHAQTSEQKFVDIIAKMPRNFEPGADYLYSNPGYFLLGKVIQKVTGEDFSTSVYNHIFAPLKMVNSGVTLEHSADSSLVQAYEWNQAGGYNTIAAKNLTLFGAGAAIYSNVQNIFAFEQALYNDTLINSQSKQQLFNPKAPYSWRVGDFPISASMQVSAHMYDGKIDGYSSMLTRFVDDKHSIIILSNTGMNYFLKRQLTSDIAAVLYDQDLPSREQDIVLALTSGIYSNTFDKVLADIKENKYLLDEQSMTSIAYELLWSNLADKALQMFSVIREEFSDSTQAQANLEQACQHRLTMSATVKAQICGAIQN